MKRGAETKLVHRMIHTELYCSDCWWFFQTWSYNTKRSISIITPWFKVLFKFFQQWEMRVKRQIFWQRVMNLGCGGVDIFALHIYESWVRNHLSFEENTARYQFALSRDDHDFWICFVLPVNKQGYQLKLVASLQMINKLLLIWHKEHDFYSEWIVIVERVTHPRCLVFRQ